MAREHRLPTLWGLRWPSWADLPSWMEMEPEARWLRVEEFQEDGSVIVRAELPDIDPEKDVEVSVTDSVLHIQAHKEAKKERKSKSGYRSEFRYGEFERSIPLPPGTSVDDVKATYRDGVLEVRVPKAAAEEEITKVPVSRS